MVKMFLVSELVCGLAGRKRRQRRYRKYIILYLWEKDIERRIPMAEKTTTAKSTVKEEETMKAAEPAAETKESGNTEAKKEEKAPAKTKTAAKKTTAKKTTVKKTTTKKTAAKEAEPVKTEEKPAPKRTAKKAANPVVHLQFSGKSYSMEDLQKIANDVWKYDLHNEEPYTSLELYVKPEENIAYYVFNGEINGNFFI